MARRSPFDPEILDLIQSLAIDADWSATQVHRKIEETFPGRDIPSLRAVQAWVKKYRPPDPSGPWSLRDADGEMAALVLPALAAVITFSRGNHLVTRAEAAMIARIRTACPDVPLMPSPWGNAWYLARLYLARENSGDAASDLDALLAFAPWRDGGQAWQAAVEANWIRAAPLPQPHARP